METIVLWSVFETALSSATSHSDPFNDVDVECVFVAPSGTQRTVHAFWDGGATW
ncbi:MAG: DUF5060 domain-containing protein, partial [Planctomycetota bacterium]